MTAPAGAIVSLYVDLVAPVADGDIIETQTGRRYQVLAVRVQARGKRKGRQHLSCLVIGKDGGEPVLREDGSVSACHRIRWYTRGKARRRA